MATTGEKLLAEFDSEMALTRGMLACVPDLYFAWAPHARSFTLGKLVNHLVVMPAWVAVVIHGMGKRPEESTSKADLLGTFDRNWTQGRKALAGASDAELTSPTRDPWGLGSREAVLRSRGLAHMIHHRGQLSVYLRLLDVPIPGMYGPSADIR